MKRTTIILLSLCSYTFTQEPVEDRGHHHHHHGHHHGNLAPQEPNVREILNNIFGIIINGIAISQGAASPQGHNHIAIGQHLGAIFQEISKSIATDRAITADEIIKKLQELGVLEQLDGFIKQKSLTFGDDQAQH